MNIPGNDHDKKDGNSASLKAIIESAWEGRADLSPARTPAGGAGEWQVNQWLKKAVLLSFRIHKNEVIAAGYTHFFDKLPLRWGSDFGHQISEIGARIVPPLAPAPWWIPGPRSVPAPRLAAPFIFPVV
jgi:2,3,4,5-tetrahydropyridine-2-carboxylate N-succinyltransferase